MKKNIRVVYVLLTAMDSPVAILTTDSMLTLNIRMTSDLCITRNAQSK